jgi:membrane-associated phospholipid phosphatase
VNLVAAVPSLHAAYPLLMTLFVGAKLPKLVPLLTVYVLAVWMAIVYLGEHYVFDIVTGVIYAVLAYLLVIYWPAIKTVVARWGGPRGPRGTPTSRSFTRTTPP